MRWLPLLFLALAVVAMLIVPADARALRAVLTFLAMSIVAALLYALLGHGVPWGPAQ